MSVASWCCTCFCVVLCVSFCTGHFGALKLDICILFTTFCLRTSLDIEMTIYKY